MASTNNRQRSKPKTIRGEPTAKTVEEIDRQLKILFQSIGRIGHPLLSAAHSDTTPADVQRGDLVLGVSQTDGSKKWERLAIGIDSRLLRSNGLTASWAQVVLTSDVTGRLPFANLTQGSALSVLGVAGNAVADHASIVAANDAEVLRRSGTSIGFGTVATAGIANDAVTFAKLLNATGASKLIGRGSAGGGGDFEEITLGSGLTMTGTVLSSGGGMPPIVLLPDDSEPTGAASPAVGTRNTHPTLDFDDTTLEAVSWHGLIPSSYPGNGLEIDIYYVSAATSGTVGWLANWERMDVGGLDIDADSYGTLRAVSSTVPGTSGVIKLETLVWTNSEIDGLVANEIFRLRIRRDATGSVVGDSSTGDAQILAIVARAT